MAGSDDHKQRHDPLVTVELGKLREAKPKELCLRFSFGAGASLLAGVVSIAFGPRVGGVFLAFPAILPAGLTLIEKKEGLAEATQDLIGAVLGALGLVVFAVVGGGALKRFPIGVSLLVALGSSHSPSAPMSPWSWRGGAPRGRNSLEPCPSFPRSRPWPSDSMLPSPEQRLREPFPTSFRL
jgi:hypothetical protein